MKLIASTTSSSKETIPPLSGLNYLRYSQRFLLTRNTMNVALIYACQMFLIPSTILFAALGAARTEGLKILVSIMGLVTKA
jgi:hypothetical protein